MACSLFPDLCWLPESPADFNVQCRDLASLAGTLGEHLRTLSGFRLKEQQLVRLSKQIFRLRQDGRSLHPLNSMSIAILSNATVDFVVPAIAGTAPRHGLDLTIATAHYGQVMQEVMSPRSTIYAALPQAILLAMDYRWFPFVSCPGDTTQAEAVVEACLAQLRAIKSAINRHSNAICIFQSLAPPVETLFGNLDRGTPGTLHALIDSFNAKLAQSVAGTADVLLDVAGLAATVGLARWHDTALWNMAKSPFQHDFLPLYADHLGRILGSLQGKSRRCLILDLDNTVWGGVVGDDGLNGIKIAQGDATGEAHLDVQRMALALHARGIVLAVSSKNADEIARLPFLEHPEMLLKLHHIGVFQANWQDKATNIKAIARSLSLGLESMVFLDDNPVERALVRTLLPQVAVPELPLDPALYARTVNAAGYFEATHFSTEDMERTSFYRDNAKRVVLQEQAEDIESYLASLKMEITFQPFDDTGRPRIAQLIAKSNQFNLTTRRYSERDIERMQRDETYLSLQVRLRDIFGDNGMISVVIARPADSKTLEIDTWLMSCRVLGRGVEHATLQEIVRYAQRCGYQHLLGRYIPTERNALVENHYADLGFKQVEAPSEQGTLWQLPVSEAECKICGATVQRVGFAEQEIAVRH